ncbi:MAG: Na/Pi symporter [Bryobacterales bacterium]|nr:Na/Pi symporter [Bryobacterales bacterium]MDE0295396.1 Na/Pi symporter [Bryobacterales bacterium]
MTASPSAESSLHPALRVLVVVLLLFLFLTGVKGLGDGFKLLGQDLLDSFFRATENPFVALMIGILATTLVQSSSVSTSMIVGLVAAPENPLPIENAIPMVMGTNIGTTVTNTVVSLAHMTRRDEFQRAFAVATCHDFFNFLTVAVLLPLELATGLGRRVATALSGLVSGMGGVDYDSPLKGAISAGIAPLHWLAEALVESGSSRGAFIAIGSALVIISALVLLVRVMRAAMQSQIESNVTRFLGRHALVAILFGAVATVMVQSSSITTSLLVPLAGAGLITLNQAFPVTLGANVGTTVTALLASMAVSGANAQAGIIIALVHLLFNVTGMVMIYPIPAVREIPLRLARWFAGVARQSRGWAVVYIVVLFYGLPSLFAFLSQ